MGRGENQAEDRAAATPPPAAGLARPAVIPSRPRPRRIRLDVLLVPVLLLALLGDLLWFAPGAPAAAAPARAGAVLPLAAVNPLGADVFLEREVDSFKKDKTAELLRQSGLGWIKQEFPWSELEFRKGYFVDDKNTTASWTKFDAIVQQAADAGLQVIARLDRTPTWARQAGATSAVAPPAHLSDFGDFVATFVQRYKGRIHALQIWNEPNLAAEWNTEAQPGRPVNAAEYVALLKEAATRARAVDPDILILSAPLATTNENWHLNQPAQTPNLRETVYLDEMYAAGAAPYFDIVSANAFGYNSPPEEAPSADSYNFRRVELLRAVMEQHGEAQKPIWITEYAWNAPDPGVVKAQDRLWGKVSLEQQADYTVRGVQYAWAHWPWAGVFVIWYFRQVGDIPPDRAEYYFGMVTPDFVTQPIYRAVQAAAAQLAVAGPGSYGPLSAPLRAGPGWGWQLTQPADTAAPRTLLLVAPAAPATLTITFRGTDLAILCAPAAPGAPPARLYVTVDGSTSNVADTLPRDEAGRPYIGAGPSAGPAPGSGREAAPPATPRLVPVVAGLGSEWAAGTHQAQLQAAGPGAAIAGFQVGDARSYLAFGVITGLLLAALGGDLLLLRRARTRLAR